MIKAINNNSNSANDNSSVIVISFPNMGWNTAEIGYEQKTTFWQDFTIAEAFGLEAVLDTYKRAFNEWKTDHVYITELALVMNHKGWQHYNDAGGEVTPMAEAYFSLWYELSDWCYSHLEGEELEYFYSVTD